MAVTQISVSYFFSQVLLYLRKKLEVLMYQDCNIHEIQRWRRELRMYSFLCCSMWSKAAPRDQHTYVSHSWISRSPDSDSLVCVPWVFATQKCPSMTFLEEHHSADGYTIGGRVANTCKGTLISWLFDIDFQYVLYYWAKGCLIFSLHSLDSRSLI